MRRVAAKFGLEYDGAACRFVADDFDTCDIVLAMDTENRDFLLRLARTPEQREKVHLLRAFDPQGGPNASVPDPYYGGVEGFEEVYRTIERSLQGLLAALEKGQAQGPAGR
jgi:protein-tyrosine phosphatase